MVHVQSILGTSISDNVNSDELSNPPKQTAKQKNIHRALILPYLLDGGKDTHCDVYIVNKHRSRIEGVSKVAFSLIRSITLV